MRSAATMDRLRLGVLWAGERVAAAQFWLVAGGDAMVLKLAHDEGFKSLSPGTVLTALMLRGLLDDEGVSSLDFGRGDDPYKASWTTRRRQRIGLMLINPRRLEGLATAARSLAGRLRSRAGMTPR
jgi:CelD/BcsL family acetyltransferase involved in cellulose biosynthesis